MAIDVSQKLLQRWADFSTDVEILLQGPSCSIADADLPDKPGVYILINERRRECYVGKATRSLRDRVLRKHVSGDESHALQRAYMTKFPDRLKRRTFIKDKFHVKWIRVRSERRIAELERWLIWLLKTDYNRG